MVATFSYAQAIRQLVWQAKISACIRTVSTLKELFLAVLAPDPNSAEAALVSRIKQFTDEIVAAPSSLWGRLRGRFDLGGILAAALAEAWGKPLRPAPWELGWSLRKRAGAQGRSLRRTHGPIVGQGSPRILIVDDVWTTGTTVRQTAAAMGCYQAIALALASANVVGFGQLPPTSRISDRD